MLSKNIFILLGVACASVCARPATEPHLREAQLENLCLQEGKCDSGGYKREAQLENLCLQEGECNSGGY